MSNETKRNEVVAIRPYLWITQEDQRRVSQDGDCVIACPHIASAPSDAVYLYHSDDYAALQGEVSRLCEREAELSAFVLTLWDEYTSAAEYMGEGCLGVDPYRKAQLDALNLEPPTDGQ